MAKAIEYIWLSNDACLFRDKTHCCVEARRNATSFRKVSTKKGMIALYLIDFS
jgi:hypothetical protein